MKKIKNNKVLKIILKVIKACIIITLLAFILVVFLQRFSNNKLSLFNYRIFAVATGSMQPKYNIGDVLISKDVDPSKLKVGDNISYLGTKSNFKGKVITHQIVKIETDENGKLLFYTKGIANLVEDPVVEESQVYGKVIYKTILLSWLYKFVSTSTGFGLIIVIPIIIIIGYEILATLLEKKEEEINSKRK
jgi:signal peptidase I